MTKQDFQKELQEKIKPGVKASDLKKLKRSKSADDIPTSSVNPPLQKSKSQLEIPSSQPTLQQQIFSLQDELTIERKKVSLLREDLNQEQEKNKQLKGKNGELEQQILQLRLDKIKEFGDYLEKKEELTQELELNINAGTQEINRLETKLLSVNKKKLELQQQLGQAHSKNASLELQMINNQVPTTFNYWPVITTIALISLAIWLFNQQQQ